MTIRDFVTLKNAEFFCKSLKGLEASSQSSAPEISVKSTSVSRAPATNTILWILLGTLNICGPVSSVGITTDYVLDGPGSNPGLDEIFRQSRPALEPTQPPVKWVPGLSPGVKCGRGVLLTTHPLLVPRSWKSRAITLPILWATPGL